MSPVDMLRALRQKPFTPFRVEVSDGSSYEIRHPELVMVGLGAVIIGIPAAGQPQVYERAETVSLGHVVKLIPRESTASKPQNGPA